MSVRYVESVVKRSCISITNVLQSVVKRSCISITNVLSVSAYDTITTKPIGKKICWKNKCHFLSNKKFRLGLHIEFCTHCVITTQTRRPPTPSHMRHSQSFDKVDSFLKPVLKILILCNLIVGWGEGVIKEGAGIFHQIYRFRGTV